MTISNLASLALGYGAGVLSAGLLAVFLIGLIALGWWRFCQAVERTGIDVKIPLPIEDKL